MTKKLFFIFFAAMFLVGNVAGESVSLKMALNTATQFVNAQKKVPQGTHFRLNLSHTHYTTQYTTEKQPLFYIFNVGDNQGFVIVSGDNAAEPILGYSDEGGYDDERAPENMKAWLNEYAEEIAWARNQHLGAYKKILKTSTRENIPYLIKAKWGQGSPFNLLIPQYSGKDCYAGCVAVTMSQIMYYWATEKNYRHGSKAIPGYITEKTQTEIPALDAIEQFDWDNMTNTKPTTTESINAVALLIRYCGQSVQMNYSPTGSGANSSDTPKAFQTFFGYDKRIRSMSTTDIKPDEWEKLLYHELEEGRPVFMSGHNLYKDIGHAFICDGYNATDDKYHFNWGWNGSYNGYFAISALNPFLTYSYNDIKSIVIGIQPNTNDSTFTDLDLPSIKFLCFTGQKTTTRDKRTDNFKDSLSFIGYWKMETAQTGLFDYACGVFDEDDNLVMVVEPKTSWVADYEARRFFYSFPFGAELPYGKYTIMLISKLHGHEEWKKMNNSEVNYATMTISEKSMSVTTSYDVMVDSIYTSPDDKTMATLTNHGTEESLGYLTFTFEETETYTDPHLAVGETKTVQLNYDQLISDSTNIFVLSDDTIDYRIYDTNPNYSDVIWRLSWDNYSNEHHQLFGDTCKARLLFNNKGTHPYHHEVTATLFEAGTDPANGITQTATVALDPQTSTIVALDFAEIKYDIQYDLQLSFPYGDSILYVNASENGLQVTPVHGVVAVCPNDTLYMADTDNISFTIPDDAIFVDARYTNQNSATFNGGNTNTLFVFKSDATPSTTLNGRNVVKGNHADCLTLTDGLNFMSPVDFEAEHASFSRIFEVGHGKTQDGWSTIVLPFDVLSEQVTINSVQTSWYLNKEDKGQKFFLFGFDGDQDGTPLFNYVSAIKAYQPYIIAVPNDSWGAKYDLRNKTIVFNGTHTHIKAGVQKAVTIGNGYDFVGCTHSTTRNHVHALNDAGSSFTYTANDTVIPPFRAYFVSYDKNAAALLMRLR